MTGWLLKFWCRKGVFVCGSGIVGNLFLLLGIITAALNTSIAGFTPVVWLLLAFILYVIMIFSITLRIMTHLETQR